MFDLGWSELLIVAAVAVVIVGPNEMPRVVRSVMGLVRKVREMATDFQTSMEDIANDADIEALKKEMLESEKNLESMLSSELSEVTDLSKISDDFTSEIEDSLSEKSLKDTQKTKGTKNSPKKTVSKKASTKKTVKKSAKELVKKGTV